MRALAVFHDGGGAWYARFLKPGFRHCTAVVACGDYWIELDGRDRLPYLSVIAGTDFDLKTFYEEQGYTVLELNRDRQDNYWPWMRADCLGAAKKMLGVRGPLIYTPHQLYKYLKEQQ